jgi:uncharacterized membrane protein
MEMGPVELMVVDFPGNEFSGEIIPALVELVQSDTIHIIDLVFVIKDADGNVDVFEAGAVVELAEMFADVDYEVLRLLNDEDIELVSERLPDNSSAALIVWENLWSARFATAVRNANGIVVENMRIPREVVQAALDFVDEQA